MSSRILSLTVLISGLVIVALLAGCATVDQKINLNYTTAERSFGHNGGDIAVSRKDSRSDTRNSKGEWIIGSINNVHGVHQADLVSDRNVGEWITDALLLELKKAGYSVTYTADLPASAARGIMITDINAFLNVNQGAISDEIKHELKFNIEIFLNGMKTKTFTVSSRENKTLPLSASKEEKEKIMLQALQDAIQQIIPEINTLTGKK
ncbi:MAG TPA: YajG family lipoprotein [Desulfuromonadaceae bacterium]|jgi:uncharacterized lipoprotein YajG